MNEEGGNDVRSSGAPMNIMNRFFGRKPDPVEQAKAWKQTLRWV